MVDGTTNLTTTMMAPAFASQGHFYGVNAPPGVLPTIIDSKTGSAITPNQQTDSTTYSVE